MAKNFKEFLKIKEGLQTQLGQRAPGSVTAAAARAGADIAADLIPGGGAVKAAGELLWDIIANRRQRVNFNELNSKATQHKEALQQAGIDPQTVFRLDDNLAKMLSDEAIWSIMADTIAKLDQVAQNGYRGLPRGSNLVELVALNKLRPFVQSLAGGAPKAIPLSA